MNNPDTTQIEIIDSTIKSIGRQEHSLIKRKETDSVFYYGFKRKSNELISISIRSKINGDLITLYMSNGELIKAIYRPRKTNNSRIGGLYYFTKGDLIYKEEFNITSIEISKFFDLLKSCKRKSLHVN